MESKKEITQQQYLSAYALLHLAKEKIQELKDLEESLAAVLEVEDSGGGYFGYVSDAIYNQDRFKDLLNKLGIKGKKISRP